MILSLEAPNKFGKSIPEFGETHSSVPGCESRPVSASIMSRSCFTSFPVCVYKFSSHYLNNKIFIDNSLGPLATESPCISIVKPIRCTNVSYLFYFGITLHVSKVFPSIIRSLRLYTASRQQYLFDICLLLYVQSCLLMKDGKTV